MNESGTQGFKYTVVRYRMNNLCLPIRKKIKFNTFFVVEINLFKDNFYDMLTFINIKYIKSNIRIPTYE